MAELRHDGLSPATEAVPDAGAAQLVEDALSPAEAVPAAGTAQLVEDALNPGVEAAPGTGAAELREDALSPALEAVSGPGTAELGQDVLSPPSTAVRPSNLDMIASLADLEAALAHLPGRRWRDATGSRLILACGLADVEARLLMSRAGEVFHFHLVLPVTVASADSAAAALALCAINERLAVPGFGFERDTGAVYFRVSVPVTQAGLPRMLAASLVELCVGTAEQYWERLVCLGRSPVTPDAGFEPQPAPRGVAFNFGRLSPPAAR